MATDSGREKLWSLIKKHRFAMLTTIEHGDALRSRPMTTIDRDFDGTLWFFVKADSAAVNSLRAHSEICLSYSDPGASEFICVAGIGSVVTAVDKKKELWNAAVQAWFPEGPTSPLNVLIKVEPNHAEFWDSPSSKLVQLFTMAKALVTHTPPQDMGEHREVPMDQQNGRNAPRSSN